MATKDERPATLTVPGLEETDGSTEKRKIIRDSEVKLMDRMIADLMKISRFGRFRVLDYVRSRVVEMSEAEAKAETRDIVE